MNLTYSFSKKPIPWAGVFSAILILVFEIFVFFLPPFLQIDTHFAGAQITWKQQECQKKNSYQTLFFGESFGLYGFKPTTYDKISRYAPSFNLCVYEGSTYLTNYYLLKKYLKQASTLPKLVILEFTAQQIFDPLLLEETYLIEHLYPFLGNDPELMQEIRLFCPEASPLFFPCWKRPMQGLFRRLWNYTLQKKVYEEKKLFFHQEQGYVAFGGHENPDTRKLLDLKPHVKQGKISPLNSYFLEKMLSLLQQHQIAVVIVVPCLREDRRYLWNQYRVAQNYSRYLKQLQQKFSNIRYIASDFVNLFSRRDDFQDILHLHNRSAEIFSTALAKRLNALNLEVPAQK